jgi:hypothetical protein
VEVFQYLYSSRIAVIEDAFRKDSFEAVVPFQILLIVVQERPRRRSACDAQTCSLESMAFPHAITLVAGLALFAIEALGGFSLREISAACAKESALRIGSSHLLVPPQISGKNAANNANVEIARYASMRHDRPPKIEICPGVVFQRRLST